MAVKALAAVTTHKRTEAMIQKRYARVTAISILLHCVTAGIVWGQVSPLLAALGVFLGTLAGILLVAVIGCELENKGTCANPYGFIMYAAMLSTIALPIWNPLFH